MSWPERLKPDSAWMGRAVPFLFRHFRELDPFPLDNRHLPPGAIQPDIPRNMPRGSSHRSVFLDGVEPVVKRIVDLPLDEAAADPKPAGAVSQGPRVDAARHLMGLESFFPGRPGVGHDQLFAHDEPIDLKLFLRLRQHLLETIACSNRQRDGDKTLPHGGLLSASLSEGNRKLKIMN